MPIGGTYGKLTAGDQHNSSLESATFGFLLAG